ncbi:MAG: NUDIX hydrolase [Deltaproteobacteria bacterium]|uniref:NUDIX domain-containing protein n=1 Tax=Hydrosulfovibrio ferrireducens TaxID=2934181 RepID=UPI00121C28DD|nr:MAG: NUDIX hydrolase [Deltaproteobacteria bacterium]
MVSHCPACGQAIPPHRNPVPTVDIIIAMGTGVILVKRKNPPVAWALPGGFVDYGESLEQAAVREACEETGLSIRLGRQFHTYSEPDRDPRQHTVSTVFLATAEGTPVAGDDAGEVAVFHEGSLPPLAFDHARILGDYFAAQRAVA